MDQFIKWFVKRDNSPIKHSVGSYGNAGIYATKIVNTKYRKGSDMLSPSSSAYNIMFLVSGKGVFCGSEIKEGQVCFVKKDSLFSYELEEGSEYYRIGFDGEKVEQVFDFFNIRIESHQIFDVEKFEYAKAQFSNTVEHFLNVKTPNEDIMVVSMLFLLLPLLKEKTGVDTVTKVNYAAKVRDYIHQNYSQNIKMEDIAKELHITEKHMYRVFVEQFGVPPKRFLFAVRMSVAKSLLETGCSVKETSVSVGYNSIHAFSKAFAKFWGYPPSSVYKLKEE